MVDTRCNVWNYPISIYWIDSMQPIQTPRTTISPINFTDQEEYFQLYSNEKVREYLWWVISRDSFEKKFQKILWLWTPESWRTIREKETENFIWMLMIHTYHDDIHFEISYQLMPNYRWKWYATEVLVVFLEHLFSHRILDELYAETQKKNIASIKLLERIWMTKLCELERCWEQQCVYSIKSDDFVYITWDQWTS